MARNRKARYELGSDPRILMYGSKLSKFSYLPCDMPRQPTSAKTDRHLLLSVTQAIQLSWRSVLTSVDS